MRHPSYADSSSFLGRSPKYTQKADSSSLSNMCNSISDLLVTHTLTQSNRPSRLPFAVWSATCWTNPNPSSHHYTTCSCQNIWCGSWSTCGSKSDLIPSSSFGRWIHIVSYRSNMPCQAPRTRAGDVAPRDVSLEWKWTYLWSIICIHAPGSSASCFLYSPMKHCCV